MRDIKQNLFKIRDEMRKKRFSVAKLGGSIALIQEEYLLGEKELLHANINEKRLVSRLRDAHRSRNDLFLQTFKKVILLEKFLIF